MGVVVFSERYFLRRSTPRRWDTAVVDNGPNLVELNDAILSLNGRQEVSGRRLKLLTISHTSRY